MLRIILNGKKAANEFVRAAITTLRDEGQQVDVRVTYEYGDVHRLVDEAIRENVKRIVIGGGDGSVNEAVDALARFPREQRPELAVLPLGTANDFASACQIPVDSMDALRLASFGTSSPIDMAKANDRHFINVATAGFGAQVTTETPVELKNFLGGGAYTLTGVLKAVNFVAYKGKMTTPDFEDELTGIVGAICNGRQAGGGQVLAPKAYINDGLLDVAIVLDFPLSEIQQVIEEIQTPGSHGQYVRYFQTPWVESESEEVIPLNLDGEPYRSKKIRFEIIADAIDLVLPDACPCLR